MMRAVDHAEDWAEGIPSPPRSPELLMPLWAKWHPIFAREAIDAANWTIRKTLAYRAPSGIRAEEQHLLLLRDIFGNPYRPATIDPAWRTPDVISLTRAIEEDRAFNRMPILGDALEEAGCDNIDILRHCRLETGHVRGCWVVDALLGKV
jgi:hypothetical protein